MLSKLECTDPALKCEFLNFPVGPLSPSMAMPSGSGSRLPPRSPALLALLRRASDAEGGFCCCQSEGFVTTTTENVDSRVHVLKLEAENAATRMLVRYKVLVWEQILYNL